MPPGYYSNNYQKLVCWKKGYNLFLGSLTLPSKFSYKRVSKGLLKIITCFLINV